MKLAQKLALSLALVGTAGILLYIFVTRRSDNTRMLDQIAEEGYETAQDVLFPGKNFQDKNLHYGPVIPK